MKQQLVFTNLPGEAIDSLVSRLDPSSTVVIADSNTADCVVKRLAAQSDVVASSNIITVRSGDDHKNLESLSGIWQQLSSGGYTRKSLVINVGGGMVTDMGGFAAATFKRGLRFVNVPTTLLAAVDASVGGKTGINFNGCKNEIGAFAESEAAVISTIFFDTLPRQELLSGYAEMLKHALIDSRESLDRLLNYDLTSDVRDPDRFLALVRESVAVKERIVSEDLHEQGIRRALNLGHTAGHAFESFAMTQRRSPIPHGYAVAWGMVVELVLSRMLLDFPGDVLHRYADYVRAHYGAFTIDCKDYPALLALMGHDKKNVTADRINFSLLADVGEVKIDCEVSEDDIKIALDIYRDLMGI